MDLKDAQPGQDEAGDATLDVDFSYSADQQEARERARRAVQLISEGGDDPRSPGTGSQERCVAVLAEVGLLGLGLPKAWGGDGMGWLEHGAALAELSALSSGIGVGFHVSQVAARLASRPQVAEMTATGEGLATLATREPGSVDDHGVSTRATAVGSGFRIDGRKAPVVLLPGTRWILVAARHDAGLGLFLVGAGAPGCTVTPIPTRGLLGCPLGALELNSVEVGEDSLVATWPDVADMAADLTASVYATRVLHDIRSALHALEIVVADAKTKMTFGKPLLKWQTIQFRLLDAQARLELLEPVAWYYLWALDHDVDPPTALCRSRTAYGALLHRQSTISVGRGFEDASEIGGGRMFNEAHPLWQRYVGHLVLRSIDLTESSDERILGAILRQTGGQL